MDVFLKAIESSHAEEAASDTESSSSSNKSEPQISFEERPPQWCIVDKWFNIKVLLHDPSIKELEAVVYNTEGVVVKEVLQSEEIDNKRLVSKVANENSNSIQFRLKFVSGSKGAWLYIGIHNPSQAPEKCLLKSPPIKVQTNRSKRPRDSKKKPVPTVTSLSPNVVPSTGNFLGRKDRMLLIFGTNFYLWGNSPIVRLRFVANLTMEIRPPNVIWWSDHLLECQLPECHQDIEIQVANYDLVFGDGKILKVDALHLGDSKVPPKIEAPLLPEIQQLSSSKIGLDYTPAELPLKEPGAEIKILLYIKDHGEFVHVESTQGYEKMKIADIPHNIGVLVKLCNRVKDEVLEEFVPFDQGSRFVRQEDTLILNYHIPLNKITVPPENVSVVVTLRKETTKDSLIDPSTRNKLKMEKPAFAVDDSDDSSYDQMNFLIEDQASQSPRISESQSAGIVLKSFDLSSTKQSILDTISKASNITELNKLEDILTDCLEHLEVQREGLRKKSETKVNGTPKVKKLSPKVKEGNPKNEDENDKTIAIVQLQRSDMPGEKGKQTLALWKFFNPGNRTFLELSGGKLQIIGSRRIQMLIESVPASAKFSDAHLYVQKNDTFDMIENCSRCKENGIPNVFCVLPRRGREHDYPWITFRITCTSTAKHWKGSPFWIGADFIIDQTLPTQSTIKVFSPPIHVQSKDVKP